MNTNFKAIAILAIACASFAACSNDDVTSETMPVGSATDTAQTFTVNINASSPGSQTRALAFDGTNLKATWKVGETVKVVHQSYGVLGTLTAQSNGATTTLSGTLPTTYEYYGQHISMQKLLTSGVNDRSVWLLYPEVSLDYTQQDGTLAYISDNLDFADACLTSVTFENNTITTDEVVNFINCEIIIKFNLKDVNGNDIMATKMSIDAPYYYETRKFRTALNFLSNSAEADAPIEVNTTSPTNEIWVSLFPLLYSPYNITLTAETESGDTYTYTKDDVSLSQGSYYDITVRMTKVTE